MIVCKDVQCKDPLFEKIVVATDFSEQADVRGFLRRPDGPPV